MRVYNFWSFDFKTYLLILLSSSSSSSSSSSPLKIPVSRGSEVHSVTSATKPHPHCPWCNLPLLTRLWGPSHSPITDSSSAEEMLQNSPVQRQKGGKRTTGVSSGRLVTRPRELSITFKPQFKANMTAKLTTINDK